MVNYLTIVYRDFRITKINIPHQSLYLVYLIIIDSTTTTTTKFDYLLFKVCPY
jgi:hypothetical protein